MNTENYVWKEKKTLKNGVIVQQETKLIDMDQPTLNRIYSHCKQMLYNSDKYNPGRMIVLEEISEQIDKCGAELALRWFLSQLDEQGEPLYTSSSLSAMLRHWTVGLPSNTIYRLQDFIKVDSAYMGVSIDLLQKACKNMLGGFNHSKITYSFLYRTGVFFTPEQLAELQSKTVHNTLSEALDVIKAQLNINDSVKIRINYDGLNEDEFFDMIHLKRNSARVIKYSDMTTSQLMTLRSKVLFILQEEIGNQATTWKKLMDQIIEVANVKHFTLY